MTVTRSPRPRSSRGAEKKLSLSVHPLSQCVETQRRSKRPIGAPSRSAILLIDRFLFIPNLKVLKPKKSSMHDSLSDSVPARPSEARAAVGGWSVRADGGRTPASTLAQRCVVERSQTEPEILLLERSLRAPRRGASARASVARSNSSPRVTRWAAATGSRRRPCCSSMARPMWGPSSPSILRAERGRPAAAAVRTAPPQARRRSRPPQRGRSPA